MNKFFAAAALTAGLTIAAAGSALAQMPASSPNSGVDTPANSGMGTSTMQSRSMRPRKMMRHKKMSHRRMMKKKMM